MTETNQQSLSFLYVEDDPMSRDIMEFILQDDLGHVVTIFPDSIDFIQRVEALPQKPDLIFLDIHLTPHDGFEMLSMLRQHEDYREAHVVAMTASVMNEEIDHLRRAGFDSCLSKPIQYENFPKVLLRLLSGEKLWRI
jgi:CheY-like chemotaxis protein